MAQLEMILALIIAINAPMLVLYGVVKYASLHSRYNDYAENAIYEIESNLYNALPDCISDELIQWAMSES